LSIFIKDNMTWVKINNLLDQANNKLKDIN